MLPVKLGSVNVPSTNGIINFLWNCRSGRLVAKSEKKTSVLPFYRLRQKQNHFTLIMDASNKTSVISILNIIFCRLETF